MADPSDLGHGKKRKKLDQYCHIGDKYDILVTNIFILGAHTVILGVIIILGTTTRHITYCITSVSSSGWSKIFSSDFVSTGCWLYCVFCVSGRSCLTVHVGSHEGDVPWGQAGAHWKKKKGPHNGGEWGGAAEQAHPYSPLTLGLCLLLAQWLTMGLQDRGTAQLAIRKRDGNWSLPVINSLLCKIHHFANPLFRRRRLLHLHLCHSFINQLIN